MVKPAFQNLEVDLWVDPRRLGSAQPSVCIFHDRADAGLQILEAIAELDGESRQTQITITCRLCARPRALHKLKLRLDSVCDDLKVMCIGLERDTARINMTDEGLSLLKNAFTAWFDGAEDFGVSPRHGVTNPKVFGKLDKESGELWFWGPHYFGP